MAEKILIIDDDLSFKKIIELRLKAIMPDASVTHFACLTDVRNRLRAPESQEYDLIVIDQHLPDGRGSELLAEGWFRDKAILSVSSDSAPEIPGAAVQAGATFFLSKRSVGEPLFKPLILGIIDRNRLARELERAKLNQTIVETVKTLVGTLRHEINNPLGAVLGGAYLLSNSAGATPEQREAAELVESSGKRIKHVLEQLCKAVELDPVNKANQTVFHIPGDKEWESKGKK